MVIIASPAFRTKGTNPYQALLYEAMERQGIQVIEYKPGLVRVEQCDILHFHWPEVQFLAPSAGLTVLKALRFLMILFLARRRGTNIVWTAHNFQSHARAHPKLEKVCWIWFIRNLAGVIYLSQATRTELQSRHRRLQRIPDAVIPHGHYRAAYPPKAPRLEARKATGLPSEGLIFAWVGQIRKYKGVEDLAEAWRTWSAPEATLLIAGKVIDAELAAPLAEACAGRSDIVCRPGWIDQVAMRDFLCAADIVILPYREIATSGSALLALSFDCPVALPRSPAMEELRETAGGEWVYLYDGDISPRILQEVRAWVEKTDREARASLDDLDWDHLARLTVDFFRGLTSRDKKSTP